jgi:NAD-dependent SIR2 family protein deacetylase
VKLNRATFAAEDLEAVEAVGRFRCVGCSLDVHQAEPADPLNPTQVPRCARCGDLTAPVNRGAAA